MSIVASRRKLAKQVRSIKGKQGKAAAANIIGEEIDDLLGAYAVKTAPTKAKNKNIETGAEEAGVELEELDLKIFDRTPFSSDIWSKYTNRFGSGQICYVVETSICTTENQILRMKNPKPFDQAPLSYPVLHVRLGVINLFSKLIFIYPTGDNNLDVTIN